MLRHRKLNEIQDYRALANNKLPKKHPRTDLPNLGTKVPNPRTKLHNPRTRLPEQ